MKKLALLIAISCMQNVVAQAQKFAPSIPAKDTYHGVEIVDEYRNIENLKDTAVINWMKVETDYSQSILKSISKRDDFLNRMRALDKRVDFTYSGLRITLNKKYFYFKTNTSELIKKLYFRQNIESEERLLFDPQSYKPDNKLKYVISYFKPNNDGSKLAIALTEGGKEISEIIIYDLEHNKVLPEVLTNTWASGLGGINWLPDNSGIIYNYIPDIDMKSKDFIKNTKSVMYKIGDNIDNIKDVFSKSNNPELTINPEDFPTVIIPSKYDSYIFGRIGGVSKFNDYYYAKIDDFNNKIIWEPFFKKEDKIKSFTIDKDDLFYITEKEDNSIICKTLFTGPNFSKPQIIVEQIEDEVIEDIKKTKEGIFFTTIKNGVTAKLYFYNNINYKEINLPIAAGSISLQILTEDLSDIWIYCSGWTQQNTRYKFNLKQNTFTIEDLNKNMSYPEYKDFVVEEIEVKSHDGLNIPLTIIYKKGIKKNGKNRLIMNGYGSYGNSVKPNFNPYRLLWVLDGGILVNAHVRGGYEKGEKWRLGGFKETKPNTWKDFISSAEYLIKKGYTSKQYFGIEGGSAGGIMIGRSITEKPDLFKAAAINVGILNTLRSEKMPNGANNVKEFGTVENKEEFKYLLEMDAFHHIKKGMKYPATLITAGMNDPRVIAWQPAKFAAKLQANNASNNPILLNVDFDAGHGGNVSLDKQYESIADTFAFFYWQLGHPDYKLKAKK